ncbi:MAG: hypothetical protein FWH36_01390 [Lentimicrobiaceae bacterium]|nr:hypothetical protein [Lentimicrobiaceae bacterium]
MKKISFILIISLLFIGCGDKNKEKTGRVDLQFTHHVDGKNLVLEQLIYANAAGNIYQVSEVKYFISDLYLLKMNNEWVKISQNEGVHYVDLAYPNTLIWNLTNIQEGDYKGISFVFGLNEADNQSNRFVNSPEKDFFWPTILGGGYHYLQINGKWKDEEGNLKNMNFHAGIGQLYKSNVTDADSIYAFIHNYFRVDLPVNFVVERDKTTKLNLTMNIDKWFSTPIVYDHNYFGSGIMQNQQAQEVIRQNGKNVFSY